MHIDDFRHAQQSRAPQDIQVLFMACRRRFLNAARLLELRGSIFDELISSGLDNIDHRPLMSMFGVLCDRYAEQFFTPQEELFESPADAQDIIWSKYFHRVLIPVLIQDDGFVRNVLRVMMVVPCNNPQLVSEALVQHVTEMTFPERRPLWAPDDVAGY